MSEKESMENCISLILQVLVATKERIKTERVALRKLVPANGKYLRIMWIICKRLPTSITYMRITYCRNAPVTDSLSCLWLDKQREDSLGLTCLTTVRNRLK